MVLLLRPGGECSEDATAAKVCSAATAIGSAITAGAAAFDPGSVEVTTAAWFGAGYYGGSGFLRGRMVFPIHNEGGELVIETPYGEQSIKLPAGHGRKEIAEIVGVPVHLFLFVKVRENWGDDPERYRAAGLEFPKD